MAGRQSKGAIKPEIPGYYKFLSKKLYRVLEDIGASVRMRDLTIKAMTTTEILMTMCLPNSASNIYGYIFGSSFEGTTTPDLASDIDILAVHEVMPVATNIDEAKQRLGSVLLLQDSYTPAGYAKLQAQILGMRMTREMMPPHHMLPPIIIDAECRLVTIFPRISHPGVEQHGPAASLKATQFAIPVDCIDALKSCSWPDCASEWLVRERHYNWPSREQIDICKTLGCFFVQVGHPRSEEVHLQWRLSFSLQERLLVTSFNSIQLKCYILAKMIKKEMIHKPLGEKSLTSYHLKTCMFYTIENTPAEFWTEENLLVCLRHYLRQLLILVETGVCPNYFIPEENMFDGRVSGQKQVRICEILRLILSTDFKFLLNIKSDMLGLKYKEALDSGVTAPGYAQTVSIHLMKCCFTVYQHLLYSRNRQFINCQNTLSEVFVQELYKVKQSLQRPTRLSGHGVSETREALSILSSYVDITLMSVRAVENKRKSASDEVIFDLLASERWHALSLEADSFSAKLKQASLMYMLGYCELSLEILQGLQDRLEQQISVCGCYGTRTASHAYLEKSRPSISECSYEELLHRHFIPCIVYLPAERDLTPPVLCYEMGRSAGSPPEDKRDFYDWAVVDGKVLFYFLLYLNHHHFDMHFNATSDVLNIYRLAEKDYLLRHRETAWNIIGWLSKEKGSTDMAERFFLRSLNHKPTHNAAALHLQEISRT